ncbi:Ig-like protein group 2 [Kribbella amoyensis]|uniref:Ig-like protein group 2 n=1 Tax=Kribbella amoyensis TaxID=996641 RepID=A0A561BXA6_9ACTN|nr:DNRLRE domain-containing protein [Kribbella amoyensis]TWD83526.1 Ig-like protein group 2 [Kribbella amoyensis]
MPSSSSRLLRPLSVALAGLLVLAGAVTAAPAEAAAPIEPPASVVDLVSPTHPRVLATPSTFTTLADRLRTDQRLQRWQAELRRDADAILTLPVPKEDGSNVSGELEDEIKRRVYTLALEFRLTADQRYADRAIAELLAVAGFTDWNPSHFLDVGEMASTVAVGYDWLYDELTAGQRSTLRAALVAKALRPALTYYAQPTSFFTQPHNWNLVCNAVALAALAIADEEPEIADQVLRASITSIQNGIEEYHPDGGYAESPVYWAYGTEFLVAYLAAMTTATGTDFGLSNLPGLAGTGDFAIHATGPLSQAYNFGDGGSDFFGSVTPSWHLPSMQWLADRYDKPYLAAWASERADQSPSPLDLIWYDPATSGGPTHPGTTDSTFDGVEFATARSAWDDPYAVGVATKGLRAGYDQVVAHEGLDAGNVVVDANGVRWLDELGSDGYGLPGYFDWRLDSGGRWDYYVARAEGNNTMVLGNGPVPSRALTAGAPIRTVESSPHRWSTITDLTAMYGVPRAQRGVQLFDDRRQVLIQDEVQASSAIDYTSILHTRADVVTAADQRSAMLYRSGQRLWLQVLTPGAKLTVGTAKPLPGSPAPAGQSSQPGVRTVRISLPSITSTTVAVRLVPLAAGEEPPTSVPAVVPLSDWGNEAAASSAGPQRIAVGGAALPGYSPNRFRYDVTLPASATVAPRITVASGPDVRATVSQASGVVGVATVATSRRVDGRWVAGARYQVHFHQPGRVGRAVPIANVSADVEDGTPAANVVDGSLGSRWSAAKDGASVTLDLGNRRTVGAFATAYYNGFARTSTFDLQVSTDGKAWTTVLDRVTTSGRTDDLEVFGFAPRPARYLRLVGHGNSVSSFTSILELRVYANQAEADAPPRQDRLTTVMATPSTPTLLVGAGVRLQLAGTASDGSVVDLSTAKVSWSSDGPGIASIDASGNLTAVGGGRTTVTALVELGSAYAVARVPVTVDDPSHLEPSADGYVYAGTPDTTTSKGTTLEVRNNPDLGSGFERIAYLTFKADRYGCTIQQAVLHLYGVIGSGNEVAAVDTIRAVTTPWSESTLTWNNRPAVGTPLATINLTKTPTWSTADLTTYVRTQLCAGQDITLALTSAATTYGPLTRYPSREAQTNRPYLQLTLQN